MVETFPSGLHMNINTKAQAFLSCVIDDSRVSVRHLHHKRIKQYKGIRPVQVLGKAAVGWKPAGCAINGNVTPCRAQML